MAKWVTPLSYGPKNRTDCPWCHRNVAVNAQSKMYAHYTYPGKGIRHNTTCFGSRRTVQMVSTQLKGTR